MTALERMKAMARAESARAFKSWAGPEVKGAVSLHKNVEAFIQKRPRKEGCGYMGFGNRGVQPLGHSVPGLPKKVIGS